MNLVIANAGIGGPSIKTLKPNASLEEFENHLWGWTAEEFTETFAANTTGAFNTVAAFLQLLGEGNKKGNVTQKSQVIATSSIGAFNRSLTQGYAYGGSKAAVVHIFKQLATTLVPYDIRSNIIAPGCKLLSQLLSPEMCLCLDSDHMPHYCSLPKRNDSYCNCRAGEAGMAQEHHPGAKGWGRTRYCGGRAVPRQQSRGVYQWECSHHGWGSSKRRAGHILDRPSIGLPD